MSGPREPEPKEAQLPDDLDQNPGIGQSEGLFAHAGSADAELIAGENSIEGDVENDTQTEKDGETDNLGRTND